MDLIKVGILLLFSSRVLAVELVVVVLSELIGLMILRLVVCEVWLVALFLELVTWLVLKLVQNLVGVVSVLVVGMFPGIEQPKIYPRFQVCWCLF